MANKKTLLHRLGRGKGTPPADSSSSSELSSADVSNAALELGVEVPETSGANLDAESTPSNGGDTGRSFEGLLARARSFGLWSAFFGLVFSTFAWVCMPTKAIAWRISQVAKANGFIVEIDDVRVMPWGTVKLDNVAWHFPTKRSTDSPVPFIADSLSVRIAPVRFLLGELVASLDGEVDTGSLHGSFSRGEDGLKVEFELDQVPLYALPKVQQSLNAPIRGDLSMRVELSSPDETFAAASGKIELQCSDCKIGDGETKLFVPSAKGMLASGMTVPEINFGNINGAIVIEDGVGTAEEILSKSDDVTIMIYGSLVLAEPISKSDLDLRIKMFISPEMQAANADIGLMVATASTKTKLTGEDAGGLGYRLLGTFGRPKLRTFQYKSAKEKRDERASKAKKSRARGGNGPTRGGKKPSSKSRTPSPKPPGATGEKKELPKVETATAVPRRGVGDEPSVPEPTEAFLGKKEEPSRGGEGDPPEDSDAIAAKLDPFGPAAGDAEGEGEGEDESEEEEASGSGDSSESGSGSGDGDGDDDEE